MKSNYDIMWLDSVDSTNDEARRHISELDNLSVLSAMSQTSGRGQRGNSWLSEDGKNLMFSIVLKYSDETAGGFTMPAVQAYDQSVISQLASLSVADLLAAHDIQARIKWPNDIYVGDRKICGMLIENAVRGKWLSSSIIGIGLNVNQRNFDVSLPNPTSMALCIGSGHGPESRLDLNGLLEEFLDIFTGYIDRFCHITGGYNRLSRLYHAQLWRLGEQTDFIDTASGTPFRGIIRGTSPVGHLLVELHDGTLREFAFKEIAYAL